MSFNAYIKNILFVKINKDKINFKNEFWTGIILAVLLKFKVITWK